MFFNSPQALSAFCLAALVTQTAQAQTPSSPTPFFPDPGIYTLEAFAPDSQLAQVFDGLSTDMARRAALIASCLSHPMIVTHEDGFVWLRPPRNRQQRNRAPGYRSAQRWNCEIVAPTQDGRASAEIAETRPEESQDEPGGPALLRCPLAPLFHDWPLPTPVARLEQGPEGSASFALRYSSVLVVHHPCAETDVPGLLDLGPLPEGTDLTATLTAMHRAARH